MANAPIVMQMPNTIGKCTYQLSSSLIGFVDDAFVLSMKSVFHTDGWTGVSVVVVVDVDVDVVVGSVEACAATVIAMASIVLLVTPSEKWKFLLEVIAVDKLNGLRFR